MLVTNIFFFSHNVFKSILLQGHSKLGFLSGKGLSDWLYGVSQIYCMVFNIMIVSFLTLLNPLPGDKILTLSKLKTFADNRFKAPRDIKFVICWVWKIVEKKKMLVTSIFSFSHNVFKRPFPRWCLKLSFCGERLKQFNYITANSAPIHAFLEFLLQNQWLLSHKTIIETMVSRERGMNTLQMAFINP